MSIVKLSLILNNGNFVHLTFKLYSYYYGYLSQIV